MNADQMKEFVELCKHPAIAGRQGGWRIGDEIYNKSTDTVITFGNAGNAAEQAIFIKMQDLKGCNTWLPPVFDYQHPERGLIGMLTSSGIFSCDIEWQPGLIDGWRVSINWYKDIHQFTGATQGIALAKAVIWQSERKQP